MKNPFQFFNYQFQTITRNIYETDQPFRQEIPYNDIKVYKTDNRYLHKQYASLLFKMKVIFNIV